MLILKKSKKLVTIFFLVLLSTYVTFSKDLNVSLPILPPLVESKEKGILVDLIKAMSDEYEAGNLVIQGIFPFQRSMNNVVSGYSDMHMPILLNKNISENELDFAHSSETIFKVVFCLYTNKDNLEINSTNLDKYKIETDRAHVSYFDFPIKPSDSIAGSLKKVNYGLIDGFIFAMPETDGELKKLKLKNVKRRYYNDYDVKIVLSKDEKGIETDKIISKIILALKKSGKYNKIMQPIFDQKFIEWQMYIK